VTGPFTLSVDCGGTGVKCRVLDAAGLPVTPRTRLRTPYPCPPQELVRALQVLASTVGASFDRVSVGMPGVVRDGVVRWTPHYVTEAGPFTAIRPDLVRLWEGLDVRAMLEEAFARPTRVVNDAEMAGLAVTSGHGYEVMLTLGTGLGFAHYADGVLLPKIEVSATPFTKNLTFDQALGHHVRREIGDRRWTTRVLRGLRRLHAIYYWDNCYLGGGGAKHLTRPVDAWATVVGNEAGLLGGVRLWDDPPGNVADAQRTVLLQTAAVGASADPAPRATVGSPATR
jgi:polyphosphate glucokinase